MNKFLLIVFILVIIFYGMFSNYQKKLEIKKEVFNNSKIEF